MTTTNPATLTIAPPTQLGPLTAPPQGVGALSSQQLSAQAVASSTVVSWVPQDVALASQLTLEELVDGILDRIAQLQAAGLISTTEAADLHQRVTARRDGAPPPSRATHERGHAPLTAAAIVAASLDRPSTDFDLFGDFLGALVDLGGAILGGVIGGPAGAAIGAMVADAIMTAA